MHKSAFLKGKSILVTAGPTWVAIDRVRVITNIFSGRTGCIIAQKAKELGARVTLLLGPGRFLPSLNFFKEINVLKYHYFDELFALVKKEVSLKQYDIIIHSAAIADYAPVKYHGKKISSGKKDLTIRLKPTVKIIKSIKKWDPGIFLVQFKLEVGKKDKKLIEIGYKSMSRNKADLVVVNDLDKITKYKHPAYIVDLEKNITQVSSRDSLANKLWQIIKNKTTNIK